MKYLLLFEKFKSKGISKTLKFIKSKSKASKVEFLSDLRKILNNYKFPISEFTDDDIEYMSAKKAKEIKVPEGYDIMNPYGVYAIKFLFSLDKYIGYTGIGKSSDSSEYFDQRELNKIKEMGYETGTLEFLYDLKELKTGDKVVGYFDSDEYDSRFAMSTILVEDDGRVYAVQNVSHGSTPRSREWRDWGRYCWSIGNLNSSKAGDNRKLHLWTPGDNELEIVKKPLTGDAYVNRNGGLTKSRTNSIEDITDINESDFALVLYIDPLIKYESVEYTKSFRKEAKSGATALLTDDQIKKINYERYITKLISSSGISKETTGDDIKDLQKIIIKTLVGRFALITVYRNTPEYKEYIDRFLNRLKELINADSENKDYQMSKFLDTYKWIIEETKKYEKKFIGSLGQVEDYGEENTKTMVKEVLKISEYLFEKVREYKVDTIEDGLILLYKLRSLEDYVNNSSVDFKDGMKRIIQNFNYNDSDVRGGIINFNNEFGRDGESVNNEVRKTLSLIKRFIDKTF